MPAGKRSSKLFAIAAACAAGLAWTMSQAPKPFYYDSGVYWSLGATFAPHGRFSLLNFDSSLRGYFLPLVDRGLRAIAADLSWQDSSLAKLFNVLIFALIATVLVPALAERAWPERRWGPLRRIVLAVILIALWGGYLAFPLSDFAAVAMVLLAIVSVAQSGSPGWMLTAGLACGIAIDMRPAYVLLAPAIAVPFALDWWADRAEQRSAHVRRGVCLAVALVGFAVVSAPQALATHRHFGSWSFIPGSTAGLSTLQYTEGLHLQLYDTYVGSGEPGPQMDYVDATGTRLLAQRGGTINSASEEVQLLLNHPLDMLGLFARHEINGLDERYDTPYVEHVGAWDLWSRVIGFGFVFLALVRVFWPAARRSLGPARWRYPAALLISGLAAIPSAVEARFMLPTALFSYMIVLTPGWSTLASGSPTGFPRGVRLVGLLLALAAFCIVVTAVVTGATHSLRFG